MNDDRLHQVFSPYGTVKSHKLLPPGRDGKTAAIITFASVDQASWLVQNLDGNMPQGLTEAIRVRFKDQASKGGKGPSESFGGGFGGAGAGGGYGGGGGGGGPLPGGNPPSE